nr:aminotransferase class V-fold PLP-dependent enzyme [Propionibacterium sp.]
MIYLDNAATSWPKPDAVGAAMVAALAEAGNPGRSAHGPALAAGRILLATRRLAAELFGASPDRVVLTGSATMGLNLAIAGLLSPGDHAVTTDLEHNSVLRPLYAARQRGVALTIVRSERGQVGPDAVAAALRPETRAVVLNHASNVLGTVQPLDEIAAVCAARGVPLIVDAAQTAGALPVDLAGVPVAALACGGHKALHGPAGTGLLVLAEGVLPKPLLVGGTGFDSFAETMPADLPEALEAGTPNVPGFAGLNAALELHLADPAGPPAAALAAAARLRAGLAGLGCWAAPDVVGWGVPVVSGSVLDRAGRVIDPGEVADQLWQRAGIAVRAGYHCAPLVHRHYGSEATGLVRFSPGPTTTDAEIDAAIATVRAIHEAS